MTAQKENDQLRNMLSSHFFSKENPSMSLAHMPSLLKTQLAHLGSWWAGDAYENGDLYCSNGDFNRRGVALGNVDFFQPDYWPYTEYLGGSHRTSSGFAVTGTEAHIISTRRGLTLTGYFGLALLGGVDQHIFGRWDTAGVARSYRLYMNSLGNVCFGVSSTGGAWTSVVSSVTIADGEWFYACGRYDPGTALYLTVNDTTDSNLVGVPASLYTAAPTGISIARDYNNVDSFEGRMAWCAVHGAFHDHQFVFQTREMSLGAFRS